MEDVRTMPAGTTPEIDLGTAEPVAAEVAAQVAAEAAATAETMVQVHAHC
jgi:hypothetical protein